MFKTSKTLTIAGLMIATSLTAACNQQETAAAPPEAAEQAVVESTETAETYEVIKTGSFEGRNDHITTGDVSIVKTSKGYLAILNNNFSLDGAPAPTIGFGSGDFDTATEFSKLENIAGTQVYTIPDNIDVNRQGEFYIYCADFKAVLGVAKLK